MSQSIDRAIDILALIGAMPRNPSQVARELEVHRSTALRMMETLTARRLLRRLDDGRYSIGGGLLALAHQGLEQLDLARVAHPFLAELSRQSGDTIHLAELQGDAIVYTAKIDPTGMVQLTSRVGQPALLHTASVAKAILAYLPADRRAALLNTHRFDRYTEATIDSIDEYERTLATVRERGWAVDRGEREDFINAIAAPVRDASGAVVAAVSVIALKVMTTLETLETRELQPLLDTAAGISAELGWNAVQDSPRENEGTL